MPYDDVEKTRIRYEHRMHLIAAAIGLVLDLVLLLLLVGFIAFHL